MSTVLEVQRRIDALGDEHEGGLGTEEHGMNWLLERAGLDPEEIQAHCFEQGKRIAGQGGFETTLRNAPIVATVGTAWVIGLLTGIEWARERDGD